MAGLSAPIGYTAESRRVVLRTDWPLLIAAALLLIVGLLALFSVGQAGTGSYFKKQALYVLIGFAPFAVFAFINPTTWRKTASWLYAFNALLLIVVLAKGKHINGAARWIPLPGGIEFQPSELAKLLVVLTLSAFYANKQDSILKPSTVLLGLLHVMLPCLLIWRQPHLGAALVVLVMWFAVSVAAGVPTKYLAAITLSMALVGGLALRVPALHNKLVTPYQDLRVRGLQAKTKDTRGRNWQTDRAEIAFGVGGVTGSGFLRGEQKQAGFIPEQYDDFIVTVIGEEGGLVGCGLLLTLYGFFFYRIFLIMLHATEPYYKMAAAGVFAMLGFHTFVNMAMVLQLVPVVGLWLPFLSYGGTAIWLCMACVGLLVGIRRRQRPLLF